MLLLLALQAQEGGSADLLGLGVPSAGGGSNGAVNGAAAVTNNIAKFHCKSNGVLYENEILQVILNLELWLKCVGHLYVLFICRLV